MTQEYNVIGSTSALFALTTTSKDNRCGAFLTAIPLHGLGLSLTPVNFRIILRHHLGMKIANLDCNYYCNFSCQVCGQALLDDYGTHAISCRHGRGTGLYRRHNLVRNVLFSVAKEAGLFPSLEPPNLIPDQNLRPADVMLPGFHDHGRSLCVDVTIVGVVSLIHPTTMQSVADRKNSLYLDLCRQHHLDFTPFVMDSYGSFHSSASNLLNLINVTYLSQRNSPTF